MLTRRSALGTVGFRSFVLRLGPKNFSGSLAYDYLTKAVHQAEPVRPRPSLTNSVWSANIDRCSRTSDNTQRCPTVLVSNRSAIRIQTSAKIVIDSSAK